jgi:hypothetical protein
MSREVPGARGVAGDMEVGVAACGGCDVVGRTVLDSSKKLSPA